MTKFVAIFGATGAQGAPVVTEAQAKGLKVRAVARDIGKIEKLHPDAEAIAAKLDDQDAIEAALTGVDAAFLHLPIPGGPEDESSWIENFIEAAQRVSLPLLIYSTAGPAGARFPSSVVIDGGTAVMQSVLNSGIPTIVLQPAIYLENLRIETFLPRLRTQGVLDYPPVPQTTKVQYISHRDHARIAAAALTRPDLAGQSYEIGTPEALTGPDLARLLSDWTGRAVTFAPVTPAEFGQRVGTAFNNPGAAFALEDLYSSLEKMRGDDMAVDTDRIEDIFGLTLSHVSEHIAGWPRE